MSHILKTLYLDMDSVVTDFEKQFATLIGVRPENSNKADHYKNFSYFVNNNGFFDAPLMPNGRDLFNGLVELSYEYDFDIKYLTSDGSIKDFRPQVMEQKIAWLQHHGLWLGESKFILSNGWRGKSDYARPDVLLVDDSARNCEHFTAAGGNAIMYLDHECTKVLNALRFTLTNAV